MIASFFGHLEVVRQLLQRGADKALQNKHGRTALDLARQRNQVGGAHPAWAPFTTTISPSHSAALGPRSFFLPLCCAVLSVVCGRQHHTSEQPTSSRISPTTKPTPAAASSSRTWPYLCWRRSRAVGCSSIFFLVVSDACSLSLDLVHLFLLCASFISHVVHCNKIV